MKQLFRIRVLGAVAGLLSAAVACGGSDNPNKPGSTAPPAAGPASLQLASSAKFGNYLVDGNGRTLYLFAIDLPAGGGNPAVSNCTGSATDTSSCVYLWPIFHVDNPTVAGIDAADVGQFTRSDGMPQTTYKGFPLYYFRPDANAGDIGGEAIPDWFVVRSPFYTMISLNAGGKHRLTDGAGRSLYFFAQDTVGNPPTSACAGTAGDRTTCVGNWPIFLASATVVPSNIDPSKITVFTRSSDKLQQSAFDGHPLYYFADDKVPGDDLGLVFPPGLGQWFNVDVAVQ
jgi:predicted lipoprotein with Yx(FWY)xxD motif